MVKINKEKRQIEITMDGDTDMLYQMQLDIIRLLGGYNFSELPLEDGAFYSALHLLENISERQNFLG